MKILWLVFPLLATAAQAADDPAPKEPWEWLTGSVDVGYRWRTDVAGSLDTYRSVVNLGEGPKLFGADFTILDPSKTYFDKVTVSGIGWGGDPYSTARFDVSKEHVYNFTFDYRNIAFFDALPSFDTPLSGRGVYMDQHSYDSHRRLSDFSLEMRPGTRIVPFLGYTRNSEGGTGVLDFVSDANEYPVVSLLHSYTDHYRGGVHLELRRFHVTVEEGATIFKDDQQLNDSTRNNGNLANPVVGQTLYLGTLREAYGIRGTNPYSRALISATPFRWLDLYGQFQYSQGSTDVNYSQANTGSFVQLSSLLFYSSEQDLLTGAAKQPHTSGSAGFEIRPLRRLRIVENWTTDRLHTDSSNTLNQMLVAGGAPAATVTPGTDRLVDNYNQHSLDVMFELTPSIMLRAGHRYVYGDTTVRAPFAGGVESGSLDRQSGVAGVSYRTGRKISANFDFEGGSSNHTYYRTSLQDYSKYRARARYQPLTSLSLTANFSALNNDNPTPGVQYTFASREGGLALQWAPQGGKRIRVLGDYSYTSVRSDILYLVPQTLQSATSLYSENAHQATGQVVLTLPAVAGRIAQITAGGSLFSSAGTRPEHFYQPLAKLSLPLAKRVDWVSEWRWYGFDEPLYAYETFRATQFSTGLRIRAHEKGK